MTDANADQAAADAGTTRQTQGGGFTALPRGTHVDAYVVDTVIGAGGFGITYLAHHATLDKPTALKEYFPRDFAYREGLTVHSTLTASKTFSWGLARFLDEARALARFKHPAIVDVAHVFEANGTAYMALAYEQGRTFGAWLQELGRRPMQAELDTLVRPLLDAMEVMHKANMLHRDIAADNILVREDGSPVLLDFGSARSDLKERAGPMTAVVKSGNSPPEQYKADGAAQGPWSDIYAFAATLYRAMMGRPALDALDRMKAPQAMAGAMSAQGDYRKGFREAVDWGMALEPADRPQSVAAWRERLLRVTDSPPSPPLPLPPPEPIPEPGWTTARKVAVAGAALAAAMLLYVAAKPAKPTIQTADPDKSASQTTGKTDGAGGSTIKGATGGPVGPGATSASSTGTNPGTNAGKSINAGSSKSDPGGTPIKVALDLPKTSFAIGDPFTFTLRANRDCNVLVFTIDANDKVDLHDPSINSAFMGPPLLKAGETRQIPIAGAPGRAVVNPPAGAYQIGAVCAREALSKLGLAAPQLQTPAAGGKRSFSFKLEETAKGIDRAQLGRVTVNYQVK